MPKSKDARKKKYNPNKPRKAKNESVDVSYSHTLAPIADGCGKVLLGSVGLMMAVVCIGSVIN